MLGAQNSEAASQRKPTTISLSGRMPHEAAEQSSALKTAKLFSLTAQLDDLVPVGAAPGPQAEPAVVVGSELGVDRKP